MKHKIQWDVKIAQGIRSQSMLQLINVIQIKDAPPPAHSLISPLICTTLGGLLLELLSLGL